jgi:hypothetical protein
MTRGLDRSTGKRSGLWLTLFVACALGCGGDDVEAAGGTSGESGAGGEGGSAGDDASIEDASDGDSSVDEQGGGGGTGGDGTGGSGGSSGESGTGGGGGESGDGGEEPGPDGGDELDAGPQDAVCFAGGDEVESGATGACDDPIAIDMSALGFGDTVVHRTGTANTNGLVPSLGKCAEGTGRDVVFNVKTAGTADLEVSVDAADGSDPIILVQDGPDAECNKSAATACVDDTTAGECEYLRVRVSAGGYDENTPQVVIAETNDSGIALVVRFRLIDPGGGS